MPANGVSSFRGLCGTTGNSPDRIEGGRYASLFDNLDDTLTVERLQVFDFEAMRDYPVLLEPLLFYVLHRVVASRILLRRRR